MGLAGLVLCGTVVLVSKVPGEEKSPGITEGITRKHGFNKLGSPDLQPIQTSTDIKKPLLRCQWMELAP